MPHWPLRGSRQCQGAATAARGVGGLDELPGGAGDGLDREPGEPRDLSCLEARKPRWALPEGP